MTNGGMPQGGRDILGWVILAAIIAFILLIMVIIFGNLQGNTGFARDSTTLANETTATVVNATQVSFGNTTLPNSICTAVVVKNLTGNIINPANYTVDSTNCLINISASVSAGWTNNLWTINSSTTFDSQGQVDSDNIITNYTRSATNTSAQLPTVGTIIGIAFLLLILIGLLVFVIRKMMGVSGAAGGSSVTGRSSGSSSFEGSSKSFG